MSEELVNDLSKSMISASQQCDLDLQETVGEKFLKQHTLVCALPTQGAPTTDFIFSSGQILLVCEGLTRGLSVKKRFQMEFDVKKVFVHTFQLTRNAEKLAATSSSSTSSEKEKNKELGPKSRDYLVVCGEHKLQFISIPDFHFYHYEIPFKLRNVFSCSTSLLVERFYDSSTEQNFHNHDTFHLYSLSNPFGELLPVIYKTNGFQPLWKFCWQSHRDEAGVVDADRNFVVVYDQKEAVHRIYMARETEEQEVHAAIRYVEQMRDKHNSTMFASGLAPNSVGRNTLFDPTMRSPAMAALSEAITSDIEGRSPLPSNIRSSFGHSTPNNPGAVGFPGNLPTPIYDATVDSHLWATTPNTPRVNTRGGLERNIHTRTLARLVDDRGTIADPGAGPSTSSPAAATTTTSAVITTTTPNNTQQSYGRLQTTASPFHRTHLTQMCRRGDSHADLLRDFTRMIRDTPRNFTKNTQVTHDQQHQDIDFGELERDPDVDLLLSKVCLECVYVEPKQSAIPRANKIFVSSFLQDMFLNLVSTTGEVMKIIPVWKSVTTTRNNLSGGKKYEPVVVDCVDATFVKQSGVTVVLAPDSTTTMIGGNERIAPLFIKEIGNILENVTFRLYPFSKNRVILLNGMRCIITEIPETVTSQSSNDLMKTCFLNMDRPFSQKLLRKWKAVKRDVDLDSLNLEHKEIGDVAMFMLESVGIRMSKVTDQPRADTPDGHGGKQMRPRMSEAEVTALMKSYFNEMTFQPMSEVQRETEAEFRCRFAIEIDATSDGIGHARDLLNAFHSQCEDWSLRTIMHTEMLELIPYIFVLAKVLSCGDYEAYYNELFEPFLSRLSFQFDIPDEAHERYHAQLATNPVELWSITQILSQMMTDKSLASLPKPVSKESIHLLMVLATFWSLIGSHGSNIELDCQLWIGQDWKKRLGLNNETLGVFRKIFKDSASNAPGRANQLIELFEFPLIYTDNMIMAIKVLLLKIRTDAYAGVKTIEPKKCVYSTPEEMNNIAQCRWKHDIRKNNVELMLNSTRPILIATNILRKSEEENMKELQDRFLTQTSYRTFSQPFGRAYFDFRTAVPSLLTSIYIPRLCVGGMVYPARVSCDPPTTDPFKMGLEWGNFYNALAAALRIGASDTVKIDNEWIVMVSKNIKSTAVVGGLTLGFGLNGHLAPFNMYHAHQMLSTFDKFHSVALLIGLSASNFTTCDQQIHKILATYLGFLMGPTPLEIRLDYTIQTAAISGLGLLFADSGNMNIAKKLVNEIGKAPNKDEEPVTDRAAYKLSAGFSLGLIMLGKGNGSATSVIPFKQNIPPMSQRLIYMMNGMRRDKCVFLPQTITTTTNDTPNLPFSNGGPMSSSQMANHVKESDNINIHQSAEPAAIALGMMFMKTHNIFIAKALALPKTITDIERLRPDSMYSRVLSYCLVMWDQIEPTKQFIMSLIPKVIREYAISALHFGIPIHKDDDGEDIQEPMNDGEEKYWADQIDRSTISQTYLYTVSAACMAIALKYSSCGGEEGSSKVDVAFKLIEFYTKVVLPEGAWKKDTGSIRMCRYAGAYTRSSCLSMLITAMSILRVGTGDVEVIRYARLLRMADKPEGDWISTGKKHFEQTIAHQALGILMMGEGRYAFKKDDLSIALTIISTYPAIPQNVADNSHYHQPLRFFWSMAVEPRLLVPYDIGENDVVEVDVIVVIKPESEGHEPTVCKRKAPLLLPPLETLMSISLGGGKYDMVHINFKSAEDLKVMRDVMSVGQGRIMLKKYSVETADPKSSEEDSAKFYDNPLNVIGIIESQDTPHPLDTDEFRKQVRKINQDFKLNSSSDYPNVQVNLNSVREVAGRTPADLAILQKRGLHLLGGSFDLWRDEVNVANAIHGLAESFVTIGSGSETGSDSP